jgi:metal-sulfur cluster biosynthetic enzyme
VNKKVVILLAGAMVVALLALGAMLFVGDPFLPSNSKPPDHGVAAAKVADTSRGDPLKPDEAAAVQAALEKVAGAEGARVALSGGVDQPWPQERALEEFQSCRKRLDGGQGLVDAAAPDQVERVCLCVAKKMQKAYPGDAPSRKTPRDARTYSRAELAAIEECGGN